MKRVMPVSDRVSITMFSTGLVTPLLTGYPKLTVAAILAIIPLILITRHQLLNKTCKVKLLIHGAKCLSTILLALVIIIGYRVMINWMDSEYAWVMAAFYIILIVLGLSPVTRILERPLAEKTVLLLLVEGQNPWPLDALVFAAEPFEVDTVLGALDGLDRKGLAYLVAEGASTEDNALYRPTVKGITLVNVWQLPKVIGKLHNGGVEWI